MTQMPDARELHALRAEVSAGEISDVGDATLDALAVAAIADGDAMVELASVLFAARFPSAVIRRYVLTDDDAAEDVLQEAMLQLPALVTGFGGRGSFRSYFSGVVANKAKSFLSRSRAEPVVRVDRVEASATSWMASRADFERALQRLPADQREVLVLREVEGRSYEDMAVRLDVPLNTVRSRLNRARRAVAAAMALSSSGSH